MASTEISDGDLRQMLAVTRRYGDDQGEALPWELLHDLTALVGCDQLSASGMDTPTMDFFAEQELGVPSLSLAERSALDQALLEHYWDSPCSHVDRSGDIETVFRVSDLVADAAYRQTGMYVDYDQPLGVDHELVVCLSAGRPQRTVRILFGRGRGSDFSDRDVAVLTLLRPHLQVAYVRAERQRRGVHPLTLRQHQVLQLIAAGFTNQQIASRLKLSAGTVRKHVENIFARLDVTSRTAATQFLPPICAKRSPTSASTSARRGIAIAAPRSLTATPPAASPQRAA